MDRAAMAFHLKRWARRESLHRHIVHNAYHKMKRNERLAPAGPPPRE